MPLSRHFYKWLRSLLPFMRLHDACLYFFCAAWIAHTNTPVVWVPCRGCEGNRRDPLPHMAHGMPVPKKAKPKGLIDRHDDTAGKL